ncbi:MAG TPA: PHP domain-containing protein, partial [Bacillota bacterium]
MHLERGGLDLAYLERFVEVARRRGIDEIGFTEHAYNFVEAAPLLNRPQYVAERSSGFAIDDYVRLIDEAKRRGLPVKLGIEMDYIEERERDIAAFLAEYPWDFVIGSVHWIGDWPFDIDPASWEGRDVATAYRDYFERAERAIRCRLFDVFAHPDLIKIFGHR